MIDIEVINSPNPYLLGHHRNYGNIVLLGKSNRNNITESSCENFKVTVERDKLYIENVKPGIFYIVNGKKISGKKTIQVGDELTYRNFKFKVSHFEYSHIDPITDTEHLYKKRIQETPELEEILSLIEQEFIHLEKIKYNEK
ncbi:hypothetical protein [Halobacteriovorax sp.]|uniref:hypothetical protein n=1 Tax=Halobacteriovorax sp. TaxID=2020862 RepID=UPI003569FC4A